MLTTERLLAPRAVCVKNDETGSRASNDATASVLEAPATQYAFPLPGAIASEKRQQVGPVGPRAGQEDTSRMSRLFPKLILLTLYRVYIFLYK